MDQLLNTVTIVCIGLMIGVEFAVAAFVGPILEQLESSARTQATRSFARRLGTVMPFWYVLSLLLLIVEEIVRHGERGFGLLLAAGVIWAGVILITLLLLVPINNRIARMEDAGFSRQLQQEHRRWTVLHRWRVLALGVAMICLCLGTGA